MDPVSGESTNSTWSRVQIFSGFLKCVLRSTSCLCLAGMSPALSPPNLPNDIRRGNWWLGRHPSEHEDILILLLLTPISLSLPPPPPRCSSPLIREGVLTSPDAEVWPSGWSGGFQGPIWYSPSVSVYVCASGCVYCLRYDFRRLGEGCASDKGYWLSLADPRGPFASCQSHGPQRGGGGAFHPHCPSQGLGWRKGCLPDLEARERGGLFLKTTPNLWEVKAIPSRDANENIPTTQICLVAYLLSDLQTCLVRDPTATQENHCWLCQ